MEKRLIGVKETAQYLDISINTLYSWVWQERIPCYKLSKRMVKFNPEEIEQWLSTYRKECNPKWEEVSGGIS